MWPRRLHVHQRPVGEKPAPISEADKALIAQAVAEGRVTVCPPFAFDRSNTLFGTKAEAPSSEEIDALLKAERLP